MRGQLADDLVAVHAGQADVQQHEGWRVGFDGADRVGAAGHRVHRSAHRLQHVAQPVGGVAVVIDDTPWRDGTTHLVMSPREFNQRLAALVPRPRLHLISLVCAQLRCSK